MHSWDDCRRHQSFALMSPLLLLSCPQIVRQVQIHRDPKRELHPHACPAPPVRKPPRSRFVLPESLLRAGSPQWAHISLPSMGKRVKDWDDEWKCLFIYLFMHTINVFSMNTYHASHICPWGDSWLARGIPLEPCFTGCSDQRASKQARSPAGVLFTAMTAMIVIVGREICIAGGLLFYCSMYSC